MIIVLVKYGLCSLLFLINRFCRLVCHKWAIALRSARCLALVLEPKAGKSTI